MIFDYFFLINFDFSLKIHKSFFTFLLSVSRLKPEKEKQEINRFSVNFIPCKVCVANYFINLCFVNYFSRRLKKLILKGGLCLNFLKEKNNEQYVCAENERRTADVGWY